MLDHKPTHGAWSGPYFASRSQDVALLGLADVINERSHDVLIRRMHHYFEAKATFLASTVHCQLKVAGCNNIISLACAEGMLQVVHGITKLNPAISPTPKARPLMQTVMQSMGTSVLDLLEQKNLTGVTINTVSLLKNKTFVLCGKLNLLPPEWSWTLDDLDRCDPSFAISKTIHPLRTKLFISSLPFFVIKLAQNNEKAAETGTIARLPEHIVSVVIVIDSIASNSIEFSATYRVHNLSFGTSSLNCSMDGAATYHTRVRTTKLEIAQI